MKKSILVLVVLILVGCSHTSSTKLSMEEAMSLAAEDAGVISTSIAGQDIELIEGKKL